MKDTRTIGALARLAGVSADTIRYYERIGLLPSPERTSSGYRKYPADAERGLRFIRRAQELGFSLTEIRDLLTLRVARRSDKSRSDAPRGDSPRSGSCGSIRKRAEAKVSEVRGKIADLRGIERALVRLVRACSDRSPTGDCPILEAMEGEKE